MSKSRPFAELLGETIYYVLFSNLFNLRRSRKRQLEVTCVDLKRKIVEGIRDFDDRLLVLYKEKLAVEKCVLAEEMKILFHDKQLANQDALDRQEEAFK